MGLIDRTNHPALPTGQADRDTDFGEKISGGERGVYTLSLALKLKGRAPCLTVLKERSLQESGVREERGSSPRRTTMAKPRPKILYAIVKAGSPTISNLELYADTDVKVEKGEEMWQVEVRAIKVHNQRAKKKRKR